MREHAPQRPMMHPRMLQPLAGLVWRTDRTTASTEGLSARASPSLGAEAALPEPRRLAAEVTLVEKRRELLRSPCSRRMRNTTIPFACRTAVLGSEAHIPNRTLLSVPAFSCQEKSATVLVVADKHNYC